MLRCFETFWVQNETRHRHMRPKSKKRKDHIKGGMGNNMKKRKDSNIIMCGNGCRMKVYIS